MRKKFNYTYKFKKKIKETFYFHTKCNENHNLFTIQYSKYDEAIILYHDTTLH